MQEEEKQVDMNASPDKKDVSTAFGWLIKNTSEL